MKRLHLLAIVACALQGGDAKSQGYDAVSGEPVPYLQPSFTQPGAYGYGMLPAPEYVPAPQLGPATAARMAPLAASVEGLAQQKPEVLDRAISAIEAAEAAAAQGSVAGVISALNQADADPANANSVEIRTGITHQPLINIKARVIEVQRADSLAVSSILDFITNDRPGAPFTEAPFGAASLNDARRRFSGITRLPLGGVVDAAGTGSGMLVNLTTANIDFLVSMLATEVNADTITAPQVTTLNGKPVEFRAGSFVPFVLGKNTIVNNVNTQTEVFYRHVGAYIKVTPQIVNWDRFHRGLGKIRGDYSTTPMDRRPVANEEITDEELWSAINFLLQSEFAFSLDPVTRAKLQMHYQRRPVAIDAIASAKEDLVTAYNALIDTGVSRVALGANRDSGLEPAVVPPMEDGTCGHCNWPPSDCTINVNLAVRVSDPELTVTDPADAVVPVVATSEENIRAIQTVVQLKSGRGVVLGGLITMRDVEARQKVPFLGDIPYVGAAFRSTRTDRVKTETLIFLEAEVLPGFDDCYDECGRPLVESMTAEDFQNSRVHTLGDVTDSPLNLGMHRAGLAGEYMPRPTHGEEDYWRYYKNQQQHLRAHRISNQAFDTFE